MKITEMSVNDLKPYAKNTRNHKDLDAANIARQIEKYGFNKV